MSIPSKNSLSLSNPNRNFSQLSNRRASPMNPPDDPPAPQPAGVVPPATAVLFHYSRRRHLSGCPKPQPLPITSVFSRNRNKPVPVPCSTIKRKTRDLPNISECHACGFRIDLSNGRNRLQPLYSEWRIVLLCKKCISCVESSAVCSYCFDEVSDGFQCRDCNRMIHKSCFTDYKSTPPWSYSCSGSDFSVCIDCWVPKQLARKRTLRRKRSSEKSRESPCALKCDKIKDLGDIVKSLQNVRKGTSVVGNSKNDGSVRSNDTAVKEDVPLVNKSPQAERDEADAQECNETVSDRVVDDAELAFQLHRSMNGSPRRSKMLCIDKNKMSIMVYRRIKKRSINATTGTSDSRNAINDGRILVYVSEASQDHLDKGSPVFPMACADPSVNVHFVEANRVVDEGSNLEDCACIVKLDGEDEKLCVPMKESEGNSLNGMGIDSQTCSKYDESVKLVDVGNVQKVGWHLKTYCKKRLSSNKDDRCSNFYDRIHLHDGLPPL